MTTKGTRAFRQHFVFTIPGLGVGAKPGQTRAVEIAIEIRHLKKHYGDRKAIGGIDLEIRAGECFGLLGPNGAGKTTLLNLLSGASKIEEGDIFLLGLPMRTSQREIKSRIGVVPQGDGLDTDLTVRENLMVFGSYFGLEKHQLEVRVQELLRLVFLEERADDAVDKLSGGMRRRLALIRAMLNDPELLILDEPTVALDPAARQWVWNFLRERKRKGVTQIVSTHYMEEAAALCDRIGLIHRGKLLEVGTPEEVIDRHWGNEIVELTAPRAELSYYSGRLRDHGLTYQLIADKFMIAVPADKSGAEILQLLNGKRMAVRKSELNDVFLKLTGSELSQGEFNENK